VSPIDICDSLTLHKMKVKVNLRFKIFYGIP
jgi:hypothetical protein